MKRNVAAATAIIAISTVALAACSGGDDDKKESKSGSSADSGITSPADLPSIPKVKHEKGVIADTEMKNCDTKPGQVTANGTAKNSAKSARDIAIVVSWTSGSGGDVVARQVAELKNVAPGTTEKWSVDTDLGKYDDVQCVLTATAGELR